VRTNAAWRRAPSLVGCERAGEVGDRRLELGIANSCCAAPPQPHSEHDEHEQHGRQAERKSGRTRSASRAAACPATQQRRRAA
jgi:hypothetical protein